MLVITIGPDQQNVEPKIVNIFLSVNFINVFWVPKRTVSSRQFFREQFFLELLRTLLLRTHNVCLVEM